MTRYFLHIESKSDLLRDEEGAEFDDLAAARRSAIQSAREIMSDRVKNGKHPGEGRFVITDAAGQTIMVVPFEDAISQS